MTARKPGSTRLQHGELFSLGLHKHHPFYMAWVNLKTRCDNPRSTQYAWYGGRGIKYCETWKAFKGFYADMYDEWAPGLMLDRVDNQGDYQLSNCRWVSYSVNAQNRRSNVVTEEIVGVIRRLYETGRYTQANLGERFGIAQPVISAIVTYKTWHLV